MAYAIVTDHGIGPREEGLDFGAVGPGLHGDERVYRLDTGELVAVSVEAEWQDNGSGTAFTVWARAIEEDGATVLSPHGRQVETSTIHHVSPMNLARHGKAVIAKELLLAALGEPMTPHPTPSAHAKNLLMLHDEFVASLDIRQAISAIVGTGYAAIDPATLLGASGDAGETAPTP